MSCREFSGCLNEMGMAFRAVSAQARKSSTEIWNAAIMAGNAITNLDDLADQLHGQAAAIAKAMNDKTVGPLRPGQALGAEKSNITDIVDRIIDGNENFRGIDPSMVGYLYKAVQVSDAVKAARERGDAKAVNVGLEYLRRLEPLIQKFDRSGIFNIDTFLSLVERATTNAIRKEVAKSSTGGGGGGATGGFGLGSMTTPIVPNWNVPGAPQYNPNLNTLISTGIIRG